MNNLELRSQLGRDEFDYALLMNVLRGYAHPRDKISRLISSGIVIRVKKGLYVSGPSFIRGAIHKETLANQIYGPSCLSLEYALSYHGLIPERVEALTSITFKSNKIFKTPLGVFTYTHVRPARYAAGIDQVMLDRDHPVLMATKEKALADRLTAAGTAPRPANTQELRDFLHDDLRITPAALKSLKLEAVVKLAAVYRHVNTSLLLNYLGELHE